MRNSRRARLVPDPAPRWQPGSLRGVTQSGEEDVDALEQAGRVLAKLARRDEDVVGERAGLLGCTACTCDILRDLAGAGGGILDAARDLARRRILLLDGGGDGGGDAADVANGLADVADRGDAVGGGGLDRADLTGDLL